MKTSLSSTVLIVKRALLLVVTIFGLSAVQAATEAKHSPRLFLLGDSIMIQYTPMLSTLLSLTWVVDGKKDSAGAPPASHDLNVPTGSNGGDSAMVLAYLQARHKRSPIQADVLLLNCGLHDIKTDPATGRRQVDLPQYRKNLEKIM